MQMLTCDDVVKWLIFHRHGPDPRPGHLRLLPGLWHWAPARPACHCPSLTAARGGRAGPSSAQSPAWPLSPRQKRPESRGLGGPLLSLQIFVEVPVLSLRPRRPPSAPALLLLCLTFLRSTPQTRCRPYFVWVCLSEGRGFCLHHCVPRAQNRA